MDECEQRTAFLVGMERVDALARVAAIGDIETGMRIATHPRGFGFRALCPGIAPRDELWGAGCAVVLRL